MTAKVIQFIVLVVISLLLYMLSYYLLLGILGFKGMVGLLVFCMAYKLSTSKLLGG